MKRAEVKVGVEYAVQRSSYGRSAARIKILRPAERERPVYSGYGLHGHMRTMRGYEGKLVSGAFGGGAKAAEKGATVFVEPREVRMEWSKWAEIQERHDAEQARKREVRESATKRIKALGFTDEEAEELIGWSRQPGELLMRLVALAEGDTDAGA